MWHKSNLRIAERHTEKGHGMDIMEHFFENVFDGNARRFAEAIIDGYDWADRNVAFSLDSDVAHVYVDDDGNFVCVHSWDMESFKETWK